MARADLELISALRATADRLEGEVRYQWTHMGSCNCGHLAQTLTHLGRAEIHRLALEKPGDWSEQARDYCPTSGFAMDRVFDVMIAAGLNIHDISHLERLSDPRVLERLGTKRLDFRDRRSAIAYIRTWADLLEEDWRREQARRFATKTPELV